MSIKLRSEIPSWIRGEVDRLSKSLPLRQVDNILACLNTAISFQLNFYLQLYLCIEEWQIDTFYWQQKIPQPQIPSPSIEYSIFKHISNINFTNIKSILIADSDLHSLQPLSWLRIPSIKTLCLSFNRITCLKPIAKCTFIDLSFLNLADNHWETHQLANLSRLKLRPVQQKMMFGIYSVQPKENPPNKENNEILELSQLIKVESKTVKNVLYVKNKSLTQKFRTSTFQRFKNSAIFN